MFRRSKPVLLPFINHWLSLDDGDSLMPVVFNFGALVAILRKQRERAIYHPEILNKGCKGEEIQK